MTFADIISVISLIIAIISLRKSSKTQNLQNEINRKTLERLKEEENQSSVSCVQARIINKGNQRYCAKIWNSGKAAAYNVMVNFSKDSEIINFSNDKLPFERLENMKSFELAILHPPGAPQKFVITTSWDDENGIHHQKDNLVDI